MSNSGNVIAPIVVINHTTSVVANQDAVPSIASPRAGIEARIKAMSVNAKPVPPRSSGTYQRGNFRMDNDKIDCVTANTTTATTKPGADNVTPGTIPPATSSPIDHEARSTTARTKIRLTGPVKRGIRCRALSDVVVARMQPPIRSLITGGSFSALGHAHDRLARNAFVGGKGGGRFGERYHRANDRS
jgi:hypothetical protein